MNKLYALIISLFLFTVVNAQPFSNNWINFNNSQPYSVQQYFKIKLSKDGIFRVTQPQLQTAGFPVNEDPRKYQIFYRGKEQCIYVEGESDGVFDATDYIEFYGRRNDGWLDANLYNNTANHINPNYSMYSDTSAYFLTVAFNSGVTGSRMIMETDVNFSAYAPEQFIMSRVLEQDTMGYVEGEPYTEIVDPSFDLATGFTGARNNWISYTIPTPNASLNGPLPNVAMSVINSNSDAGGNSYTIDIKANGNTFIQEPNVLGYHKYDLNQNLSSNADLSGGSLQLQMNYLNPNAATPSFHFTYAIVRYPHTTTFAGETTSNQFFYTGNSGNPTKVRLDLDDFNLSDLSTRYIYIVSNDTIRRVTVVRTGNQLQALIPVNGSEQKCLLTYESAVFNSNTDFLIEPVTTNPSSFARFNNYNYNSPAYNYLIISHKKLWASAQAYYNHRTLEYTPLLTDVNELYDQFAYGTLKHPLAIKNFCDFALKTFKDQNNNPTARYLFLFGKAVYPPAVRLASNFYNQDLVPTFCYPPSDWMFSNRLTDTTLVPRLATGRLAAQSDTTANYYLNKILANEVQQNGQAIDWQKQVLHFVGGDDLNEQTNIRSFMDNYEASIEDTLFGASVTSYYKISTDPIQYIQAQELQARIDSGVALMTFFGHAAGSTFDIATAPPQDWNNNGKYPLIVANSCNVGDIFSPSRLLNEDFVLLPNKGSIGFFSTPSLGDLYTLGTYTTPFYKALSYNTYGKPIGDAILFGLDTIVANYNLNPNLAMKSVMLSMMLHGDPAIKLGGHQYPDYTTDNSKVFFKPDTVTTDLSTFDVNIVVTNLGKSVPDSFRVELVRKFPNNNPDFVTDTLVQYIPYKDTLVITLPVDPLNGAGLNYFDVFVDNTNLIDEGSFENNNRALNVPLLIQTSDISPIYPYKYAIVPGNTVTLKATAAGTSNTSKTYVFEADTTDAFNSPKKLSHSVTQNGGIVSWTLPFALDSGEVWFWRVALDPNLYPASKWKESSFVYMPGLTGWSQEHIFQFKDDKYNNIIYNKPQRGFDFETTQTYLKAENTIYANLSQFNKAQYYLNNALQESVVCGLDKIHVAVLDYVSIEPWKTDQMYFGNLNSYGFNQQINGGCSAKPQQKWFIFNTKNTASFPAQLDSLESLLNQIPDSNYVLMLNISSLNTNDTTYNAWSPTLKNAFKDLGFNSIDTIQNYYPWLFFAQKGNPSSAKESLGHNISPSNPIIQLDSLLGGNWYKGYITSELIGPAINWTSLHWASRSLETGSTRDSISLEVIGVDTTGKQVTLLNNIAASTGDLNLNIDANTYPYLYLRTYIEDDSLRTPRQLTRWQIYYDEVPEAVVNPNLAQFYAPLLMEGDSVSWTIPVENISNSNMSNLLVDFYLYDKNNVRHNISSPRYNPLPAGQSVDANLKLSTENFIGLNSLWIEANPRNDQREKYHYNNYAEIKFNVDRDITNPILDVTFDGQHILNGDIVSAKPMIEIKLKDENRFLALNDTNKYRIYLTVPDGSPKQVYFEGAQGLNTSKDLLKWTPAQLPDNSFRITFSPELLTDGIYELKAQARDESGNASGNNDYRISFEVINKSTITNFINYPNPFTTSTRFVFTLTGSVVPTYLKIQIATVTGKIVREITQDQIGSIHIGRNVTDYAWDGKDEFGDQLAKGVYLYRVITSINGSSIEQRYTSADKFFTKGWGKMYLLK